MKSSTKTLLAVAAGAAAGLLAGWLLKSSKSEPKVAKSKPSDKDDNWTDMWNRSTEKAAS